MCTEFMRNVHKTQSGRRTGIRYNDRYAEDFVHGEIDREIDQVFYKILGGLYPSNICEERTLFSRRTYIFERKFIYLKLDIGVIVYFYKKNRRNFIF